MSRSKTITRPTIETAGGGRSDAGLAAGSTWVIFGDDWGAHPSTAQHLARALMPDHRIIWIDSIGMRSLQFSMAEVGEIARKLRNRMSRRPAAAAGGVKAAAPDIRLSVPIVPLHRVALARQVNHVLLSRRLGAGAFPD